MLPRSQPDRFATRADLAACRALIRGGSRTFFAASKLLPRQVGTPAFALYAFCRVADDAVDLQHDRRAALARLRVRLARSYEGRPLPSAADRAFADVVALFAIPRALPEALLEGFEWDAQGRRYETLSQLNAYAARVAGSVGAMMAMIMGARSPVLLARACDLGVAMQLTNIARDVGEDARAGRLYLPLAWLLEVGIEPEKWLARPVFHTALATVIQRLLRAADVLYERAGAGIAELPLACRPGMYAARFIYAEIGRELERRGLDSVSQRAVVSHARKARLLARSLVAAPNLSAHDLVSPPLAEAKFLIDAVTTTPISPFQQEASAATAMQSKWSLTGRMLWLLDLFERLERERIGSSPAGQARRVVPRFQWASR